MATTAAENPVGDQQQRLLLDRATPDQIANLDRYARMSRDERLLEQVTRLATDIGHLRRATETDTLAAWRLERIAGHIETLALCVTPSAADLVARTYPGDDATVTAALEHVDREHDRLRRLLGDKPA